MQGTLRMRQITWKLIEVYFINQEKAWITLDKLIQMPSADGYTRRFVLIGHFHLVWITAVYFNEIIGQFFFNHLNLYTWSHNDPENKSLTNISASWTPSCSFFDDRVAFWVCFTPECCPNISCVSLTQFGKFTEVFADKEIGRTCFFTSGGCLHENVI